MRSREQAQRPRPADRWKDHGRTVGVGVIVAAVFFLLTAASGRSSQSSALVPPGQQHAFTATAYCDSGTTKSGVRTQSGVAAADPDVLPVGSVVRIHSSEEPRYEGIYTVMDTGGAVQGRRIDLFISSCREAKEFGLKRVVVQVLRLGWNPKASVPSAGD